MWSDLVSLVQGDIQCSGKKFASVISYIVYDLMYCLCLKNMQRICDEVWLCEILNQRKCVYLQRQWNIVKLNSEIKSPSNGLCSVTIISDNFGKHVQVSKPTSVQPQQLAPTTQPKRQQHNHLHQHHVNSQQSIFSTCRISIVHFLPSATATNHKEPRSNSRCWLFLSPAVFPSVRVAGWII